MRNNFWKIITSIWTTPTIVTDVFLSGFIFWFRRQYTCNHFRNNPHLNKVLYELMICYCPISTNLEQKGLSIWKKFLHTSFIFSFTQPHLRLIIWCVLESPGTLCGINAAPLLKPNLDNDSYILGVLAKGTQDKYNTAKDATLLLHLC